MRHDRRQLERRSKPGDRAAKPIHSTRIIQSGTLQTLLPCIKGWRMSRVPLFSWENDMAMVEIWFPIEGFPDNSISDRLRFRNNRTGKILKQRVGVRGYVNVGLRRGGKTLTKSVHRLIAQQFLPNPENKPEVNHKNGIKDDNWLENFEWVTHAENMRHAADTGLTSIHAAAEASAAARGARTHCKNGHRFTGDTDEHGYRRCMTCIVERNRRYRARAGT